MNGTRASDPRRERAALFDDLPACVGILLGHRGAKGGGVRPQNAVAEARCLGFGGIDTVLHRSFRSGIGLLSARWERGEPMLTLRRVAFADDRDGRPPL